MKKIYIAGPDVFKRDSIQIGKSYVNLCDIYGFSGHYPLDNMIDFNQEKKKIAKDIFVANKNLIDECDIVIANLNEFRGKEADSGTVWECGYAFAKGKMVYGYMDKTNDYIDNFSALKEQNGLFWDEDEHFVEDFLYPINLMIACSSLKIVEGGFEDVLKLLK